MRYAFIADMHGNFDALQAVLSELETNPPDTIFCLGDIVGYGAQPAECVAALRDRQIPSIAGNHDLAVTGAIPMDYFNPMAKASVLWTRKQLSKDDLDFLSALPLQHHNHIFTLVHGDPGEPAAFNYVLTTHDAALAFARAVRPITFLAHTHVPLNFLLNGDDLTATADSSFVIPAATAALVNIGSIGQPRDANPMAAFSLFDSDTRQVMIRRVPYDVGAAAGKILAAALPAPNAYRLFLGQ